MRQRGPMVRLSLGFASAVLVLASAIALAQPDQPPSSLLQVLPGLRTAPAPTWVKQGLRLSYYSAMATVLRGGSRYDPDESCTPQDTDCTQDWNTKKWYRRKMAQGAAGVSGHGYTQVNVVLLDAAVALLDIRSYGFALGTGPPVLLSNAGAIGLPAAGSDFWINPQVLRGVLNMRSAGMQAWEIPYDLGGTRYPAIRFSSGSLSWVYEQTSGVLLFGDFGSKLPDITGWVPEGANREGSSILAQTRFVSFRQMNLPWASGAAPDWVRQITSLQYEGSGSLIVPGSSYLGSSVMMTLQRQESGANWARYAQTIVVRTSSDAPPVIVHVPRVFGPAALGGLWVPVQELRQLSPGQVLDRDPQTGVVAFVGPLRMLAQGGEVVEITELSDGNRIDYGYHRNTGILVSYNQVDRILRTQIHLQLTHFR